MLEDNEIMTLDQLWNLLMADAAGDNQKIIDYGAIFESHHVSPVAAGMTIGGAADNTWNAGDPIPTLQFLIPEGVKKGTIPNGPTYGDAGELLNEFGFKFFDANYNVILDTGSLETGPPHTTNSVPAAGSYVQYSWTPTNQQWLRLVLNGGTMHWVVYGSDFTDEWVGDDFFGPYWSDEQTFSTP